MVEIPDRSEPTAFHGENLRLLSVDVRPLAEAGAAVARATSGAADSGSAQRLLTITSALADAVTTGEVFEAVVDRLQVALEAARTALWLVDDDGRTVRLVRSTGYTPAALRELEACRFDAQPSLPPVDAMRRGEPLWITSRAQLVCEYPHLAATFSGLACRLSCLPLVSNGRMLGALVVAGDEAHAPSGDERSFLLLVARYASQALERLRLLDAERRSRAEADAAASRMTQLYRFAQAAVTADTMDDVLSAALDAIAGALCAERSAVLLFDGDDVMRFRAWRGLSDDYRRTVEGHSPWPRDATAPQPVLVADVAADPSLAAFMPLFERERIGSLAFIPLVSRGQLLGKFMVYYAERHGYTQTEIDLATAIANHLATVISRFAAVTELERTVHDNELFAGVLAHDLRNPLGAILTAAQLVLMRQEGAGAGAAAGDRDGRPLGRIIASGQRMARMIDQLLDFTRARVGGGIAIQTRDSNLAELCSQAIAELELVYADREIRCSVAGDQGGLWDPDRLLQIISNLVGNAIQHGDSAVRVALDGRQPDSVVLEVHNQGVIAPGLLPTLFDPFRGTRHRGDHTHTHARGLGLGLFVVKQLVRAHGGTVEVRSSDADGTTFTVRLPRRPAR